MLYWKTEEIAKELANARIEIFMLTLTSQVPSYSQKHIYAAYNCHLEHQKTLIASNFQRPKLVVVVIQNHYNRIFN